MYGPRTAELDLYLKTKCVDLHIFHPSAGFSVGILERAAEILAKKNENGRRQSRSSLVFSGEQRKRRGEDYWTELIFLHLYSLYLYTITMNN